MEKQEIVDALKMLNEVLGNQEIKGEICLYGGAAMCLAFAARPSTKDVDAIFHPSSAIRSAVVEVAQRMNLPSDWLNDGVKGFVVEHPRKVWMSLPNLTVLVAEAEYLFAMKAMAARVDTADKDDLILLIKELGLVKLEEGLELVEKYYPRHAIRPATRFFLEELFDGPDAG